MSSYVVSDTSLTAVADAIRAKSGESGQLIFPSGFVSGINNIGGGYSIDDIINRGYSGNIVYNGTSKIPPFAFFNSTGLISFSAPNVTVISGSTGNGYNTNTEAQTFSGCTNLESISLPKVTSYYYCGYAFYNCNKITNWDLAWKDITKLGGHAFRKCSLPTAIAFPKLEGSTYANTFQQSTVEKLDFGNGTTTIASTAFASTPLDTLILRRSSSVPTLASINAFTTTPFASNGTGGTLYVPQSLISSYESATNWSTILGYANNQILSIEGSQYETQYADGTPIT